jgi:hypothetical protein
MRHGNLAASLRLHFRRRWPWTTHGHAADGVERRRPSRTLAVCAARALGSRELGELRAGPTVKLVTDSNFCLHGSAQRPADLCWNSPFRPVRWRRAERNLLSRWLGDFLTNERRSSAVRNCSARVARGMTAVCRTVGRCRASLSAGAPFPFDVPAGSLSRVIINAPRGIRRAGQRGRCSPGSPRN